MPDETARPGACSECRFASVKRTPRGDRYHCRFNPPVLFTESMQPEMAVRGQALMQTGKAKANVLTLFPQVNPEMWCSRFEPGGPVAEPDETAEGMDA